MSVVTSRSIGLAFKLSLCLTIIFSVSGCSTLLYNSLQKKPAKIADNRYKFIKDSAPDWWSNIREEGSKGMLVILTPTSESYSQIATIPSETKLQAISQYLSSIDEIVAPFNNRAKYCIWLWSEDLAIPPEEQICDTLIEQAKNLMDIENEISQIKEDFGEIIRVTTINSSKIGELIQEVETLSDALLLTKEAQSLTKRVHGLVSDQVQANSAQMRADSAEIKKRLAALESLIQKSLK